MFSVKNSLPSPENVLSSLPLSPSAKKQKERFDEILRENMRTRSRLTVVIGPCSADNVSAVAEYAQKLKLLQDSHPNLLVVARVYTSKPHSDGNGFKGLCFHQKQSEPCNISQGIFAARKLMLNVIEIGLPVADELLYPELYPYFSDLVSYWFVGARSSEDSLHRGFASGLQIPCGVKNSTNGLLNFAVNNLRAVSSPCVFPLNGSQVETDGNAYAHLVLRGGSNCDGFFSNISSEQTETCKKMLRKLRLNDFLMADLSHANSGKVAKRQLKNAEAVASDKNIDGIMAESYLFGGIAYDSYGVSKTDDCLDFADTARLLDILDKGFCSR